MSTSVLWNQLVVFSVMLRMCCQINGVLLIHNNLPCHDPLLITCKSAGWWRDFSLFSSLLSRHCSGLMCLWSLIVFIYLFFFFTILIKKGNLPNSAQCPGMSGETHTPLPHNKMWSIMVLTIPLSQIGDQQVHSLPRGVAVRYRQRPFQQQQLPVHPAIDPHQPIRVQRPQQAPQLLPVGERISECISYLIWYVAVFCFLWQTPRLTSWWFESVCVFLFLFSGSLLRRGGGQLVPDARRSPVILWCQTGAPYQPEVKGERSQHGRVWQDRRPQPHRPGHMSPLADHSEYQGLFYVNTQSLTYFNVHDMY